MADQIQRKFEAVCPCCGARLTLDAELGRVISHQAAPRPSRAPDLARAASLLEKERERREALFRESTEEEKVKSQVLERKFKESLEKAKQEPVTRPTRDIDLD